MNISNKQTSVLLITEYFPPDVAAATGRVMYELAVDLVRYGLKVEVYTGMPSYHKKFNVLKSEIISQVLVKRISFFRLNKKSFIGRILNYGSFTFLTSIKMLRLKKFNNLLIVSSPPTLALAGIIAKVFNPRINYIYLIHDLYPEIPEALGIISSNSFISKLMKFINNITFKKTDKIVVLGENMKLYLEEKYPETIGKIRIIPNWAEDIKFEELYTKINNNEKYLLYSGNIGYRNLDILLNLADKLKKKNSNIKIYFTGGGVKKEDLERQCRKMKLSNVKFLGFLPKQEYRELLNKAFLLYLGMGKGLGRFQVPSKSYYYFAAGKPIIAVMDNECDVAKEIIEKQCGIVYDHGEIDSIANGVLQLEKNKSLYKIMAKNSRDLFENKYRRELVTIKYFDLLAEN